jgi:SAM-dependent methyltransferase
MRAVGTHYVFGDVDLAAERLARLARVFEPSLLNFLSRTRAMAELPAGAPLRVLDLGCGPGFTTRTLAHALAPCTVIGVDASERFLARARADSTRDIEYRLSDVTALDLADEPADVVYSRFLLTHLPDPAAALSSWAEAVKPGGRVLLQECAVLDSEHPALARYYELVAELQRRHGQSLHIGGELPQLVDRARYRIISFAETSIDVAASDMARLHALNIQTWQHDEAARDFDRAEVVSLTAELTALADAPGSPARVVYGMGEMILAVDKSAA